VKSHLEHPTQAVACGAAAVSVQGRPLTPTQFNALPDAERCKRCARVLAAQAAGRPHFAGYDDGRGDTGPRRRRWTDAKPAERCVQDIKLRDGSGAQCGRRRTLGHLYCAQHLARLP
jgi:hypothetical protein